MTISIHWKISSTALQIMDGCGRLFTFVFSKYSLQLEVLPSPAVSSFTYAYWVNINQSDVVITGLTRQGEFLCPYLTKGRVAQTGAGNWIYISVQSRNPETLPKVLP